MLGTQEFIKRARQIHGSKYDYSKVVYKTTRSKVIIICPIHGPFNQSYELHIRRKNGCKMCGKEQQKISKKITEEDFIKRSNEVHNSKFLYPNLKLSNGMHTNITITCPFHGNFISRAYAHLYDKHDCQKCIREQHRLTTSQFIQKSKELYGEFYSYEKTNYITNNEKLTITCPIHGDVSITPRHHYTMGCFKCKRNRMEDKWLDSLNIPKTSEYRQVRITVNGKLMILDGYDIKTHTAYLFHGDFWHGNPAIYDQSLLNAKSNKTFGQLYQDTLDYEQHLLDNGFNLVVIWESDFNTQNTQQRK